VGGKFAERLDSKGTALEELGGSRRI
jgi:hypothetical protein